MLTIQRSENINTFFDGYIHLKTFLKQFVEQYERTLRNKVEKEFWFDFKSFSQMIPCATAYDMNKQCQLVYTILEFRKVQDEFTGKVYCDLISSSEGILGTKYDIREDVIYKQSQKKKSFVVTF